MAVKKKPVTEPEQAAEVREDTCLTDEPRQEDLQTQKDDPLLVDADEQVCIVRYRVNWPSGVSLREGPGQAYRRKTVLPFGTTGLGEDVERLLREDRGKYDPVWLRISCAKMGIGWVDGAYLERIDEPAE